MKPLHVPRAGVRPAGERRFPDDYAPVEVEEEVKLLVGKGPISHGRPERREVFLFPLLIDRALLHAAAVVGADGGVVSILHNLLSRLRGSDPEPAAGGHVVEEFCDSVERPLPDAAGGWTAGVVIGDGMGHAGMWLFVCSILWVRVAFEAEKLEYLFRVRGQEDLGSLTVPGLNLGDAYPQRLLIHCEAERPDGGADELEEVAMSVAEESPLELGERLGYVDVDLDVAAFLPLVGARGCVVDVVDVFGPGYRHVGADEVRLQIDDVLGAQGGSNRLNSLITGPGVRLLRSRVRWEEGLPLKSDDDVNVAMVFFSGTFDGGGHA